MNNRSTYPLKLSASMKKEAQRLAKANGVSLNHWIAVAVARQIGAEETAAEFFKRRGEGGSRERFMKLLSRVPDAPPVPGDEIN
jgi:hypothetical protein